MPLKVNRLASSYKMFSSKRINCVTVKRFKSRESMHSRKEMVSAKRKSQLFKFKELPPYPTLLVEEMADQIFVHVCTIRGLLNSSMFLD